MDDTNNPLDLEQLTMPDIDFGPFVEKSKEKIARIEAECKEKYGDGWWGHFVARTSNKPDYDEDMKRIDRAIYHGYNPSSVLNAPPDALAEADQKYKIQLQKLFGRVWKKYWLHSPNNKKVNQALLDEAFLTGKWEELPDELQAEYHKLKGKCKT